MSYEIKFKKYDERGAGYHWDQVSTSITKRNTFVIARYTTILSQICEGKRILDIGCGSGALTYLISQKGGMVIGVDVLDGAIKFAREKTKNIRNIGFIKASACHLPFKNDCFDYVVSSDVIEHLEEPDKMLAEIKRVYNGNGKVVITTPLRFTEEPLDRMHVQEFFESDFRKLLCKYFNAIKIIKSHPVVFMELQNKHFIVRVIFNLLNLFFRFNPFQKTTGWRYYAMLTAVVEGPKRNQMS